MPEKVTIKKNKKGDNLFDINLTVTKGKVLSLINALNSYKVQSPVANDLLDMIQAAGLDSIVGD